MSDWQIYQGKSKQHNGIEQLPDPPPWRNYAAKQNGEQTSSSFKRVPVNKREIALVNAALLLRRPLLVTGPPGVGKTSLAHAVARELKLDPVLVWSINSRSNLKDAIYQYDAIGRLQDANQKETDADDIGNYLTLGPLGTALADSKPRQPRVLLIDEIDKSDIDLPNDLLNVFEEGWFDIPELVRHKATVNAVKVWRYDRDEQQKRDDKIEIHKGRIQCQEFPLVLMTSNRERELPPAFMRRCLRLDIQRPSVDNLKKIVEAHFEGVKVKPKDGLDTLIGEFDKRQNPDELATDQLLNAIYLMRHSVNLHERLTDGASDTVRGGAENLLDFIWRALGVIHDETNRSD